MSHSSDLLKSFEKSAAAQEERFAALERLTTVRVFRNYLCFERCRIQLDIIILVYVFVYKVVRRCLTACGFDSSLFFFRNHLVFRFSCFYVFHLGLRNLGLWCFFLFLFCYFFIALSIFVLLHIKAGA